jgi:uncharacterized protein YpiB (UPF0302 family)
MSRYSVKQGYGNTIMVMEDGKLIGNVITEKSEAIITLLAFANAADNMSKPKMLSSDEPLNTEVQNQ